jgi:hypothetical protein
VGIARHGQIGAARASVLAAQQAGGDLALVQVAPDALSSLSTLFAVLGGGPPPGVHRRSGL